ncbi:hypothetical protein [Acaryochloris marina]|uniref:Uncharacterized protein n=1 Tax=Acaryochloris marina (strain MBIC 11017) TaxID=329726 RepID=A8ZQZ0_ACAM1|nr:hypothetical protein [Acaryochloris marina]ABW33426.1 hypothetical protein AM1_H0076 [Acaryochloris marina MBIC11017]
MKYSPDEICKAAKAIQPYISELLDAPSAQRLERQLEGLMTDYSIQQGSHIQLSSLLAENESTRDWLRLYLEEGHPAEDILKALRIYYPLSGIKNPVESPRIGCQPHRRCRDNHKADQPPNLNRIIWRTLPLR